MIMPLIRHALVLCNKNHGMTLVEVGGNAPKQDSNIAVESAPAVGCANDTPEVYKLPMVRMSLMTDELPNVRV